MCKVKLAPSSMLGACAKPSQLASSAAAACVRPSLQVSTVPSLASRTTMAPATPLVSAPATLMPPLGSPEAASTAGSSARDALEISDTPWLVRARKARKAARCHVKNVKSGMATIEQQLNSCASLLALTPRASSPKLCLSRRICMSCCICQSGWC